MRDLIQIFRNVQYFLTIRNNFSETEIFILFELAFVFTFYLQLSVFQFPIKRKVYRIFLDFDRRGLSHSVFSVSVWNSIIRDEFSMMLMTMKRYVGEIIIIIISSTNEMTYPYHCHFMILRRNSSFMFSIDCVQKCKGGFFYLRLMFYY